ncbi:mucin-5AC-like [Galendromus occidentalis]|uniref:Mucin-5AC-like n=1 Tax=Galendromus occidentalis TaxID=34638 RepID=A0AAJ7WIV5_9ACAR|nr:mucin-5AC-like [Galendromus occidentalis]
MWSLLLKKAILCVLYVLLLYCDVIVLSQRLRVYDIFESNDILTDYRSQSSRNSPAALSGANVTTRSPLLHRTKASEDSQYIHGMTYKEHKKFAAASETQNLYNRGSGSYAKAPSLASWRIASTTGAPTTESTTVAELPYSYFGTTRKPPSLGSQSYYPDRYGSGTRSKPTARVESVLNSAFGQARIEIGLKPLNPCCDNDTETSADAKGKFRFYNSFSRERGYAPHRAVQYVTTTTTSTTERPRYKFGDRYSPSRSQYYDRASEMGLGSSGRVVGARENNADWWITTRSPRRLYTTTWVPRTTRDRIDNTVLNSFRNRHSLLDVEPNPTVRSSPRSGFDGVRGIRPWDERPIPTSTTTTTTTRRPGTLGGADEYDYYDELEKRQTSTATYPWANRSWRTTERPTTQKILVTTAPRTMAYDRWIFQSPSTTSTSPSPYIEYPPGPIYKPYEEDDDFKEWKSRVESKVQSIRKPSSRTHTSGSRMRVTGSPSLENDLVSLFKVSGVEEEDWKFVHETNSLEDAFQPEAKRDHGRYRSRWSNNMNAAWDIDRRDSKYDQFDTTRRSTRTTASSTTTTTTESPTTRARTFSQTPPSTSMAEATTSAPKVFVLPTRRIVPRKPSAFRRRTTSRPRSGPSYRYRLFTPSEAPTGSSTSTEKTSVGLTGISAAEKTHENPNDAVPGTKPEENRVTASEYPITDAGPAIAMITSGSTTTSTPAGPHGSTSVGTPSFTTTIPVSTSPTSTTTSPSPPLLSPTANPPPVVNWYTTRRPVFGEGMSIEEQLAEAMRRLHERQKLKELERKKIEEEAERRRAEKPDRFEGSGDFENEIMNDAPIVVEAVPEIADLNLREDFNVEHRVRERVAEDMGDAEIYGELINEHVMQVNL